jgi:hypothetical protein
LLELLQLDNGCKSTATPGLKPLVEQLKDDVALATEAHSEFRAISARGNYLSADRMDVQFAAKEICRFMSAPTEIRGRSEEAWQIPPGTPAIGVHVPVAACRGDRCP